MDAPATSPEGFKDAVETEYTRLMQMYLLGYYLLDVTYRNAVVTAVMRVKSLANRQCLGKYSRRDTPVPSPQDSCR